MMNMSNSEFLGPVNLGNPGEFTIKELVDIVIEMTHSTSKVVYQPLPSDDPLQRKPDITVAQQELNGWTPSIPLRQGLKYTIDYFEKYV